MERVYISGLNTRSTFRARGGKPTSNSRTDPGVLKFIRLGAVPWRAKIQKPITCSGWNEMSEIGTAVESNRENVPVKKNVVLITPKPEPPR